MRAFDETRPRPRPRTTLTFPRGARPPAPVAEAPEADRPSADSSLRKHAPTASGAAFKGAGSAKAGKPETLVAIANVVKIKAVLDPARFLRVGRNLSDGQFPIETTEKALLHAMLDPEKVQKVCDKIEQCGGPGRVVLTLHGRLGPNNTVCSPGLAANPKPQKV